MRNDATARMAHTRPRHMHVTPSNRRSYVQVGNVSRTLDAFEHLFMPGFASEVELCDFLARVAHRVHVALLAKHLEHIGEDGLSLRVVVHEARLKTGALPQGR